MLTSGRNFAAEVQALEEALADQRQVAVVRLRAVHEAWGRDLIGVAPEGDLVKQVRKAVERGVPPTGAAAAIDRFAAAEERQWEIGTWASGSGEGLASMAQVRTLQVAQAWLWASLAATDPAAAERARALADAAEQDPNGMANRHAEHIRALRLRLPS